MSADNWARCPRCYHDAAGVFNNLQRQVDASYGKVTVEAFDLARARLVKEREVLEGHDTFRTFRENYDFSGAEDGVVVVSYKGNCAKCKLKLEFREDHPIPGV